LKQYIAKEERWVSGTPLSPNAIGHVLPSPRCGHGSQNGAP
jgi:hypothetical protein